MGSPYFPNYIFFVFLQVFTVSLGHFQHGGYKGEICFEQRKLNNML